MLPPAVREAFAATDLVAAWGAAVRRPPSPGHRVLVATASDLVTGFAAAAPTLDLDGDDGDIELVALEVDPAHRGSGHGSRLLNAAVDTARESARNSASARIFAWVPVVDDARIAFFTAAGLRPDGGERTSQDDSDARWTEQRMTATLGAAP